jgi:hypothetical protein
MAGDLPLHERVLVHPGRLPAAAESAAAVTTLSGGVTHEYGPRVVIAAVPPSAEPVVRAQMPEVAMEAAPAALPDELTTDLDEVGALGLAAFAMRESSDYAEAKAQRPLAGEDWDGADADSPDVHEGSLAESLAAEAEAAAATSARLTGKVAVAIVIVEGPTAALKFSAEERTKVVAEVQNGLSWLGSQSSPAGISWSYDIRIVTLDVAAGPANQTSEQKEARWRDPAMAQLGHGPGLAGVRAFVEAMRTRLGTDWGYCAFFTKYPLGHFAYASIGGPRLVMEYANDGWGPDNIDRVFAHETGHIFGAPDEYAASGCDCGGSWGHFGVPNTNCINCAPGGGVSCIMRSNEWAMCPYTPYHLGFPQGQRYSGVFLPGTESYGLWLNASWTHFQAKWQEWSNQGLRLIDLEVTESGGQPRYSGVFRAGTGPYALWVGADWTSFQAKWQELSGQGLRLIDLAISQIGGQTRYSGVFRAGTGPYALWANADWPSFQAKWQQLSGQGLRLADLEVSTAGGQLRYSGVFTAGSGAYALWVNADWPSFQAKWQQLTGQGLRLTDLEVRNLGNQVRYSGVFAAGSGGHALWANADWASFQAKWRELSGQGLRLVDLSLRPTGIEVLASQAVGLSSAAPEDGSGMGFASVGGVELEAGPAAGQGSGAGFGAVTGGAGFGATAGGALAGGEEGAAGFGEQVLFGEAQEPSGGDASPGFGEAVLGNGRPGDSGAEGYGGVVMD